MRKLIINIPKRNKWYKSETYGRVFDREGQKYGDSKQKQISGGWFFQ